MHEEFNNELVQRFLNELDSTHRLALGDARIKVCFGSGDEKTVALAEEHGFILSPTDQVLHIQAQSEAYFYALSLLIDKFIDAAGCVGFEHLSICVTGVLGCTFDCKRQ